MTQKYHPMSQSTAPQTEEIAALQNDTWQSAGKTSQPAEVTECPVSARCGATRNQLKTPSAQPPGTQRPHTVLPHREERTAPPPWQCACAARPFCVTTCRRLRGVPAAG